MRRDGNAIRERGVVNAKIYFAKRAEMKKYHQVSGLHFENDEMILTIDGELERFKLRNISPALANASIEARNTYEISSSGYGIHWPLADEDLSVDGLLGISHTPQKISATTGG
ncbi:MAG: hypothetical protein ACI8V2_000435 [Candidatus Latescibacterota bacterium]|jgi:hypothetical protein